MFVMTLSRSKLKKAGLGIMCCALVACSVLLGRYISTRAVSAAAGTVTTIESAQDIQAWFAGYGMEVDGASITADKVKIPRKWDDSFSAFNTVVGQSGMDLSKYKGKTVEKWLALIPAASSGDEDCYGVLLVYKKKAVGAYLLEKPSGVVTGITDAQAAMAQQTSGEDFSGDWGERNDDLIESGSAQQASGEDFSGDWGERNDDLIENGAALNVSGDDIGGDIGGEVGGDSTGSGDCECPPQSQQASGEPEYTDLPMDAQGYPVE